MLRRLLLLLVVICASSAFAQSEIAPGIRLVRGAFVPGTQPDGNSIVITAPDGLVVFDTGRRPEHTQKILDLAAAEKQPIVAVVNSHWHLDHIGGNELVRRAFPDVKIYASGALAEARTGFLARYHGQLEEALQKSSDPAEQSRTRAELHLIDAADQLAPNVVIESAGERQIGGRTFQVGLETHAVTAGDVWLLDRASGVVIAGDLVTLPAPFLDTACPARWEASLAKLSATGFDLLVPGHGPPLTHRQFETYRTAFSTLLRCTSSDAPKETCIDGWVGGASTLIPTSERAFTRRLMSYYVDLLRRPEAERAKLCGK